MKTFIFSVVSLSVGVCIGYFVGHKVTKKKYQKMADEEVESVKTSLKLYYEEKLAKSPKNGLPEPVKTQTSEAPKIQRAKTDVPVINKDSIDYDKLREKRDGYVKYAHAYKEAKEVTKEETSVDISNEDEPFVISPDEFADGEENDVQTLTYYADGVLADDDYNIVKDIRGYVGNEALNTFGKYEADVVYVRNNKYKIDYEILLDERNYWDVAPKGSQTTYPDDSD